MDAFALDSDAPYGVRSLSLEEIITAPPPLPLWRRAVRFIRIAVTAWGVISLGAVSGIAAYYLNDEPETALLVSESHASLDERLSAIAIDDPLPQPEATPAAPPPVLEVAAIESAPSADAVFAPAVLPEISTLERSPQTTDVRLPRPRPNEPVITGSLGPPRYDPNYAPTHRRRINLRNPCTTLRNLGAPIRCGGEARAYTPPPAAPEYRPRAYQPPTHSN
jgi:hypothetical protein